MARRGARGWREICVDEARATWAMAISRVIFFGISRFGFGSLGPPISDTWRRRNRESLHGLVFRCNSVGL